MKELNEIVDLIRRKNFSRLELLFPVSNKRTKYTRFFNILYKRPRTGIEQIKKALKRYIKKDEDFYLLKSRLTSKLASYLLLIDPNQKEFSLLMRNSLSCNKNFIIAKTLGFFGKKEAAIQFAYQAYKSAKEYELFDIVFLTSRFLRQAYLLAGDLSESNRFEIEARKAKRTLDILDKLAPYNVHYAHNQTWGDDNGAAHLRSSTIGTSMVVPFAAGRLLTGTWQQVVFIDLIPARGNGKWWCS